MGKSASTDGSDKDAVAKQISDDSKVWVFNPGSVSLPKITVIVLEYTIAQSQ